MCTRTEDRQGTTARSASKNVTSYLCTRCSHWVHSRCSGLRNSADYPKSNCWICTACMTPPQSRAPSPPPSTIHTPTMSDKTFNILQWNANGIGNKQTELSIFIEAHDVKVAAFQESKLTSSRLFITSSISAGTGSSWSM